MKDSDRYLKIVEWSDEDQCYIGRCPGMMLGGVHGKDEQEVYRELCVVVDEWIETMKEDGGPLPKPTAGKVHSGKFQLRIEPELHERLYIRAQREGVSLNRLCVDLLESSLQMQNN